MSTKPNIRTLQMQDTIDRQKRMIDDLRWALVNIRAHTGRNPHAPEALLNGLLDSVERIADEILKQYPPTSDLPAVRAAIAAGAEGR